MLVSVINILCVCVSLVVSQGPRGFVGVRGLKGEKGESMVISIKGEAYLQLMVFLRFLGHFKTHPKWSDI